MAALDEAAGVVVVYLGTSVVAAMKELHAVIGQARASIENELLRRAEPERAPQEKHDGWATAHGDTELGDPFLEAFASAFGILDSWVRERVSIERPK